MKHLIAVSSKVNARLNACKIGLSRIGNSVGVERKVKDEEEDDDDEDEEEEEAVGGGVSVGDDSTLNEEDDTTRGRQKEDRKNERNEAKKRERNELLARAIEKTEKRWLGNNHRGDVKLTGNVFWRPLPHVVGTASFYQDSTLGLANAVNPNPERFGPYISSTDDDDSSG